MAILAGTSCFSQVLPSYVRNAWDTNDPATVTNITLSLMPVVTPGQSTSIRTNGRDYSVDVTGTLTNNTTGNAATSTKSTYVADASTNNLPYTAITNAPWITTGALTDPGVSYADSPNIDAFSRLRVSNPTTLFEAQSQYNSNPLRMEQIATGNGVAPSWSTNSRMVMLKITSGGAGHSALQSYQYNPYQPGKSQLIFITGVLGTNVSGAVKRFGYGDIQNGVFYEQTNNNLQITLRSTTSGSTVDNSIVQTNWNLDHFDGTGSSGVTLVPTNCFILVIDLQFLAMGRVRVGFDVGGVIHYAHQFLNANVLQAPYMQTATLPILAELRAAGALAADSTTFFKCAMVASEGGFETDLGRDFTAEGTLTAGSGTRTHALSVRPALLFNNMTNRGEFVLESVDVLAGSNPVFYEIVIGATFNVDPTWALVNTNYSFMQFGTGGVFSNVNNGIVIQSGYVGSSASIRGSISKDLVMSYPITLDAAGAQRSLGTLSVLLTGITGTSASRVSLNWKEIR